MRKALLAVSSALFFAPPADAQVRVHAQTCVVQNVMRNRSGLGNECHSNSNADCMAAAVDCDVVPQCRGEAAANLIGHVLRLDARSEDSEFVSTKAGKEVPVPDFCKESL